MSRIVLISDIHFGKFARTAEFSVPGVPIQDETTGGESLEKGLISLLKEKEVEYLFIAGDLTSVGSPQEFYYCEKKIISIADELQMPQQNIICGLGNHDVDRTISKLSESAILPDMPMDVKSLIEEKYQLIAASSALCCLKIIPKPGIEGPIVFSGIVEHNDFIVFVLNSSWQCSQHQEVPHGKLAEDQLYWFKSVCDQYLSDERTKIVLMHHHPIQYPFPTSGLDISMIEEGSELVEIAGKSGINLILHGHRHHPRAKTIMHDGWKNPITFICAGSLSVNAQHRNNGDIPNTMHILELEAAPNKFELYNYQFSHSEGWIPFKKYCPETPMDAHMVLGKMFDRQKLEETILKYSTYQGSISWNDLDECLHYINYDQLNASFIELLSPTHKIFGKFPDAIMLLKKVEG